MPMPITKRSPICPPDDADTLAYDQRPGLTLSNSTPIGSSASNVTGWDPITIELRARLVYGDCMRRLHVVLDM